MTAHTNLLKQSCRMCPLPANQTAMQIPVCDYHRDEYEAEACRELPPARRNFQRRLVEPDDLYASAHESA